MEYIGRIKFGVCISDLDYQDCRDLQQLVENRESFLSYPTVYALNDEGSLFGFVSTNNDNTFKVAEPMVIDPKYCPRLKLAIQLYETYGKILGCPYVFGVMKTNTKMLNAVKILGFLPYAETDENFWFQTL